MDNLNIPDKVKKVMNLTGGIHNVYHIETVDESGNVTDEKYAINLVTNRGTNAFLQYQGFYWGYTSGFATENDHRIYVGTGTTPPVETDISLESPALGDPVDSSYNKGGNTWYYDQESSYSPAVYDQTTHMLSITMKLLRCYWDYNISGVTGTTRITEVGVGTSNANLVTRSLVYDEEGNVSYIDKHINERMYITVYLTFSMNMKLMDKLWTKGIYGFISPLVARPTQSNNDYNAPRYYADYIFTRLANQSGQWWKNGVPFSYKRTYAYYSGINAETHLMTPTTYTWSHTYDEYPGTQYVSGVCFGKGTDASTNSSDYNGNNSTEMNIYSFIELPNPETIEIEDAWFDSFTLENNKDVLYIGNIFGGWSYRTGRTNHGGWYTNGGAVPATNFVTTGFSMYNHLTHEWDIDEMTNFVTGTREMKYEEVMWRRCGKLRVTMNDEPVYAYIYSNPLNSYTITAFDNTCKIYATNEYWDTSTYQLVDNASVQPGLAHCKYYVVTQGWDSTKLNPVFADDYVTGESTGYKPHRLLLQHPFKDLSIDMGDFGIDTSQRDYDYGLARPCYCEENNWFAVSDAIVYTPDIYDTSTWVRWPISSVGKGSGTTLQGFYFHRYNTPDRMVCVESNPATVGKSDIIRIYDLSTIDQLLPTDTIPFNNVTLPTAGDNGAIISFSNVGVNEAYLLIQYTNRNEAYIVDVYNESYSLLPTAAQQAYVIAGTKYCVYYNNENGDTSQVTIVDMSDNTIFGTFKIGRDESLTYTITGIVGWNNYAYISYTASNINYVECYNITTDESTLFEGVSYLVLKPANSSYNKLGGGIAYNDEVCVFTSGDGGENPVKFVTSTDPTNIRQLIPTNSDKKTGCINCGFMFPTLKYMNNGKQLILVGNGGYLSYQYLYANGNRLRVVDMGLMIDKGIDYVPLYNFPINYNLRNNSYHATGCQFPYGDGIIFQQYNLSQSNTRLWWIPIEQMIQHKMVGTTTTINSYNNPFKLDLTSFGMTIANSFDVLQSIE
jgi:hypothetical protein